MLKPVLILGHPDYKSSVANKAIVEEFSRIVPNAEIVNLNILYPSGKIDVEKEQKRLAGCDIIVFAFPIWWYSSPSLMHTYVEQVFTHGFTYGSDGHTVKGASLVLSFTTGGDEDDYKKGGRKGITVDQMLPPFTAMARLCQLDFKGIVVSHGMALINPDDDKLRSAIIARAQTHAARLATIVGG